MSLNGIREGELKEIFDALEEAFSQVGIDYYVIGALARDIWYSRGGKSFRQTRDVDFAVLVGSQRDYESVRNFLKNSKGFVDTRSNAFVMLTATGIQIDILPFGEIEIDEGVSLAGPGINSIKVNGFKEVYEAGTVDMQLETGHHFKTATLPSIVLLKLIAFDDRPEHRGKDPGDIADIISNYFELQAEFIYSEHLDLFSGNYEELALAQVSAIIIGREIKKIASANKNLMKRLNRILEKHISAMEDSAFIRLMVSENKSSVEENVKLLQYLLQAMEE